MLIDYHIHNHFSSDSKQSTTDILKRAAELDLDEICITNHVETFPPAGGEGTFDYQEAIDRFTKVKEDIDKTQKEHPNIKIKFGIELEYVEGWMPGIKKLVDKMGFDYMIGSIHEIDEYLVSSSQFCREFYEKYPEEHTYKRYFEAMYKLVGWGHFSAVGHFDICKKGGVEFYGPFKPKKYKDQIIPILKLMKEKGIGIELNTSGLRYDCNEIFPHPDILKWCVEIGVEHYTIGSDGHRIEEVGKDLNKALALAKEIGIKTLSTYSKGKPTKFLISDS